MVDIGRVLNIAAISKQAGAFYSQLTPKLIANVIHRIEVTLGSDLAAAPILFGELSGSRPLIAAVVRRGPLTFTERMASKSCARERTEA